MNRIFTSMVMLAIATSARAETPIPESALLEANLRQQWDGIDEQVQLRKIDKEALTVVDSWRAGNGAPGPEAGQDGRVVFAFGPTVPRVICSPLRFCDIELQAGEEFTAVPVIGDKDGWEIAGARAGTTLHVIVKPKVPNVWTNLALYTDRRVYHLELQASANEHMPFVSFSYPEDREAKWRALMQEHAKSKATEQHAAPSSEDYEITVKPGSLNFNYRVALEGRWRIRRHIDWAPKKVFDDGEKTIIEMPRSVLARELPVLVVRDGDGRDKIVNYRSKGKHFIVDRLFTYAALVKGVGRRQERVAIRREED